MRSTPEPESEPIQGKLINFKISSKGNDTESAQKNATNVKRCNSHPDL